jgi:hypothetical protein
VHHLRRVLPITFGFALATACVLVACSDDGSGGTSAPDASRPDAGGTVDSATPTDGPFETSVDIDSGADTGVDAGPTLTSATGNSAEIFVASDAVTAVFYEDDTILHWSNAPDCVVFVRGRSKPASAAGRLTVGGQIVGSDGGTDQVLNVDADPSDDNFYSFFGDVYPPVDTLTVNIELATSAGFAPMPVQTMRLPRATPVTVSAPAKPDAGASIGIPSTAPLTITWTAPTGGFTAEQKISFVLKVAPTASTTAKITSLYCAFPLSAGTATIPTNVLADMKIRAGGPTPALLHVWAGSAKEVKTASSSYYVEVARTDSTTLQFDVPAKLQ